MRYLVVFLLVGCGSSTSQIKAPVPTNTIPAGNYELRGGEGAATAGMPVLHFELGNDGMLRVTEGGVLHVRTHLMQSTAGEVEFHDQDGPRACRNPEPIPGRYRVENIAGGWRLRVISDACEGRRGALDKSKIVTPAR